jgi:hypothetical protein
VVVVVTLHIVVFFIFWSLFFGFFIILGLLMLLFYSCSWSFGVWFSHVSFFVSCWLAGPQQEGGVLNFLDTWVAGGLSLGGLGHGLPQGLQSPCELESVCHMWTPIRSSACSVCSFVFFLTSINIF